MLEDFFRHQHSRVMAALVRTLGSKHLDLAESAVQEALVRALRVWPMRGVPDDPDAWLLLVARNHAIDELRKHARLSELVGALVRERDTVPLHDGAALPVLAGELRDDELAMMFMCCDPALERRARVALTLKIVSGFSTAEIARAFFCPEPTVAQRIVRAKRHIVRRAVPLAIPQPEELPDRLDTVLDALYLVFNEGYTHRDESEALRHDLCDEAIRLVRALSCHATMAMPSVHALLALMLLQSSRLAARQGERGWPLPIFVQDRGKWDHARVAEGMAALERAACGDVLSDYHLLAGIAACHATAPGWEETDWARIVSLYERLLQGRESFVIELNRAMAVAMLRGPAAGLALIDRIDGRGAIDTYHLLAAARAELYWRLGRHGDARAAFERAASLAPNDSERRYLLQRALTCHAGSDFTF